MPAGSPSEQRYFVMRRVTLVGATTNLLLATAQLVGGVVSQSQALIADGAHTLSDLSSDFVVLFAARQANVAADARHPYGHGRIETLATVAVGLVLTGVALGIVLDGVGRIAAPEELLSPTPLALVLALAAIFSKEALYHYTMRAARRVRSNLLQANAWHHRSDVVSSIVVLVGVGAALAGLRFMDAVAAVLVSLLIGRMGLKMIWDSAHELIDTGVDAETQARLLEAARNTEGVRGSHELRTRRMAGTLLADIHVLVGPRISVSEGHRISEAVCRALREVHDDLGDILVHIDPEDDQEQAPSGHLPGRAHVLERLRPCWEAAGLREEPEVVLHYLGGQLEIELRLPQDTGGSAAAAAQLAEQLATTCREMESVRRVTVLVAVAGAGPRGLG